MLEFKSPQMAVQETERGGKSSLSGIFCVDVCVCRHVNTHLSTIGGLSLDLSCFYTELMTFSNLLPSFIKYHKCNPLDLAFVFLNEHFTIKWKYNLLTWNRFKLKWLPAVEQEASNFKECAGRSFPCHYNELWLELSSFKNDANAPIMYDKVVHMTCVLDLKSYCSFGWKTDCNLRHYSRIIFPQVGCYLENCSLSLISSEKWLKFQGFFTQSCHMAPEELEYSHMNFFYDTFMVLLCPLKLQSPFIVTTTGFIAPFVFHGRKKDIWF